MHTVRILAQLLLIAAAAPAIAAPSAAGLAAAAATRFPQPVRVGALLHRPVLRPAENQAVLGHVDQVVRGSDGGVSVVMTYGGLLGLGARRIAVPVDAMVLVGDVMEVVGLQPSDLDALPNFSGDGGRALGPDDVIRVGLAKPSH